MALSALLACSLWTTPVRAQASPLSVVQATDGTLYLEQGTSVWTLVPDQISDADLAALTPSGELAGAIPAPVLGSPGAPAALRVVQTTDGVLHLVQASTAWTLVPNQIGDADLAALTPVGGFVGHQLTLDFAWGSGGTWPTADASAYVLTTGAGTPPITSASITRMAGWGGTPRVSVVRAPGTAAANQIRFDVGGCTYSPATTATITVAFGA